MSDTIITRLSVKLTHGDTLDSKLINHLESNSANFDSPNFARHHKIHQTIKAMKTLLRSVLLFCLLFSSLSAPTASAMGQREARAAFLPEECVTKSVINPRTPGWVFVLNFEKLVNNTPVGCLMFYRTIFEPSDFVPVVCTLSPTSDIAFRDGYASFAVGSVRCPLNVKAVLATLSPAISIPEAEAYPYFSIIAVANPLTPPQIDLYSQPLGYYQPDNPGYHPVALFNPLTVTGGYMSSAFNGITLTGKLSSNYTALLTRTLLVEHDGQDGTYTTTHYLEYKQSEAFGRLQPIQFWTNGGTFWIGDSPVSSDSYKGTLDEVIFDPPDGGRPPSSPSRFKLYLPVNRVGL